MNDPFTISCDDCSMRCTAACADCVVTFVLDGTDHGSLVLDGEQARVLQLFGRAGMVPRLKYRTLA